MLGRVLVVVMSGVGGSLVQQVLLQQVATLVCALQQTCRYDCVFCPPDTTFGQCLGHVCSVY